MAQAEKQKRYRIRYLILSFIIAVLLWVLVSYAANMDITKNVHIKDIAYTGENRLNENGLVLLSVKGSNDMSIKLKGKRSELVRQIDNIIAEVDVSDIDSPGEYELEGAVKAWNLYAVDRSTVTVYVTVEELAHKNVPLTVLQTGSVKDGLVRSEAAADSLEISGAKSEIDTVAAAYVTVDLDKSTGNETLELPVSLADGNGNTITSIDTIRADTAKAVVHNTVYEEVELPVKAELTPLLKERYILDEENTVSDPERVRVGVLPGSSFTSVRAELNSAEPAEKECTLIEEKGMYIPDDRSTVKITPAFKAE